METIRHFAAAVLVVLIGELFPIPVFAQFRPVETRDEAGFAASVQAVSVGALHLTLRTPRSAPELVQRFARISSIRGAVGTSFDTGEGFPPQLVAAALSPIAPLPPGVSTPPPWLRLPLPPGVTINQPPKLAVDDPDWQEAIRNRAGLSSIRLPAEIGESLELQWTWISMRQAELMAEARRLDAKWAGLAPSFQAGINRFVDEYWRLEKVVEQWKEDQSAFHTYCSRTVPPEEFDAADRECRGIYQGLQSRANDIQSAYAANQADLNRTNALLEEFNSGLKSFLERAQHWGTKVIAYNQAASDVIANARREPTASECQTAIKLLTQYERLAQKLGIRLPPARIAELDKLRNSGSIRHSDLPGSLKSEFPSIFGEMTLNEIREACRSRR